LLLSELQYFRKLGAQLRQRPAVVGQYRVEFEAVAIGDFGEREIAVIPLRDDDALDGSQNFERFQHGVSILCSYYFIGNISFINKRCP